MRRGRPAPAKGPCELHLTQRAIADIQAIYEFSVERWGSKVAERYVDELEAALARIQEDPHLPQAVADFHSRLRFYRVQKHLLVCDVGDHSLIVLTVLHASRDIPHRLAELAPSLAVEVELLHARLRRLE